MKVILSKNTGWVIHHEPDPPGLWVLYRLQQRVAQYETREAAEAALRLMESMSVAHAAEREWV